MKQLGLCTVGNKMVIALCHFSLAHFHKIKDQDNLVFILVDLTPVLTSWDWKRENKLESSVSGKKEPSRGKKNDANNSNVLPSRYV